MHAVFAQLDDDNVDADNTGPTSALAQKALRHFQKALDLHPRHAQANQGVQLLHDHLRCLGPVSHERRHHSDTKRPRLASTHFTP